SLSSRVPRPNAAASTMISAKRVRFIAHHPAPPHVGTLPQVQLTVAGPPPQPHQQAHPKPLTHRAQRFYRCDNTALGFAWRWPNHFGKSRFVAAANPNELLAKHF